MVSSDPIPMQKWGGVMKSTMEQVPLPHLLKPTLMAAGVGAAAAWLFGRNPLQWGLAAGATTAAIGVVAETAFAGGVAICMAGAAEAMGISPEEMEFRVNAPAGVMQRAVAQERAGWGIPFM